MLFIETESHDSLNGAIERTFVTRRPRQRSSSSSSSTWSCRSSTSSSSSTSSDGEHFPRFALPLELELSIMGTVDQSLLDRAQVALAKRNKNFREVSRLSSSGESVRSRSTRWLDERQMTPDDGTQTDKEGMFTTTLCSTEL